MVTDDNGLRMTMMEEYWPTYSSCRNLVGHAHPTAYWIQRL